MQNVIVIKHSCLILISFAHCVATDRPINTVKIQLGAELAGHGLLIIKFPDF